MASKCCLITLVACDHESAVRRHSLDIGARVLDREADAVCGHHPVFGGQTR